MVGWGLWSFPYFFFPRPLVVPDPLLSVAPFSCPPSCSERGSSLCSSHLRSQMRSSRFSPPPSPLARPLSPATLLTSRRFNGEPRAESPSRPKGLIGSRLTSRVVRGSFLPQRWRGAEKRARRGAASFKTSSLLGWSGKEIRARPNRTERDTEEREKERESPGKASPRRYKLASAPVLCPRAAPIRNGFGQRAPIRHSPIDRG